MRSALSSGMRLVMVSISATDRIRTARNPVGDLDVITSLMDLTRDALFSPYPHAPRAHYDHTYDVPQIGLHFRF